MKKILLATLLAIGTSSIILTAHAYTEVTYDFSEIKIDPQQAAIDEYPNYSLGWTATAQGHSGTSLISLQDFKNGKTTSNGSGPAPIKIKKVGIWRNNEFLYSTPESCKADLEDHHIYVVKMSGLLHAPSKDQPYFHIAFLDPQSCQIIDKTPTKNK